MTVLLGPTPCHGCGTPVSVVRGLIATTPHRSRCGCETGAPGCAAGKPMDHFRAIVTVQDGRPHHCTERRPTMSRGATGAIPTRRYDDEDRIGFPGTGDATPPSPVLAGVP